MLFAKVSQYYDFLRFLIFFFGDLNFKQEIVVEHMFIYFYLIFI